MTHLYDMDIKFYGGVGKYLFFVTKKNEDVELGDTVMTIDIHEKGVLVSTTGVDINPKASALANTYCEMIRKEMNDVLSLTDEQYEQWSDLVSEYREMGIEHPLSIAYDEVKHMLNKQSVPDIDKDRDVM